MIRSSTATASNAPTEAGHVRCCCDSGRTLFWESIQSGLIFYYLTGLVAILGIAFGLSMVEPPLGSYPPRRHPVPNTRDALWETLTRWDGQWHLKIALEGYTWTPQRESSVAFFPGYPLLVSAVHHLTGMPISLAGLFVAHVFLLASFALLFAYVRHRVPEASPRRAQFALLAFGLFPTTFFLRMAYGESLFIFLATLVLYGIWRGWAPTTIALIVGATTATRFAGVALLAPLGFYTWERSHSLSHAARRLACLVPLACWGLLGFMLLQQLEFGHPFAFVQTQTHWHDRPAADLSERVLALSTLEPIWSVYVPFHPGSWVGRDNTPCSLFSLRFANPVFFVLGVGLIGLGAQRHWLNRYELLLAIGLLGIAYAARSYETCMQSQGRFVAAIVPVYLVLANVLNRLSTLPRIAIVSLFLIYLAVYSAMLAAGYTLI